MTDRPTAKRLHDICIVVPVYRGETTLDALLEEIKPYNSAPTVTADGHCFVVSELILVHDCGPDESHKTIARQIEENDFVHAVWLSRNFGQHAATIAGVASSTATWIVTLDEDGQHPPSDIGGMLDEAVRAKVGLVYGVHPNRAPHHWWRNAASRGAKRVVGYATSTSLESISSFRLILGAYGRAVAAYCGPRVYFDVALTWAVPASSTAPISTRPEMRERSGYSLKSLIRHFLNLVISAGVRPLRLVSSVGFLFAILGFLGSLFIIVKKLTSDYSDPGWASVFVAILFSSGIILLTLGTLAEYIGAILLSSQGRPLYVAVDENARSPLGD